MAEETGTITGTEARFVAERVMTEGRVWAMRRTELAALEDRVAGRVVAGEYQVKKGSADPKVTGNGVAVVPISGMIVPKLTFMAWLMGADFGLDEIMDMVKAGIGNPDVRAVVLDIDSPGGVVDGVPEAATDLRNLRETSGKPIVAVANSLAASAAYWLASQAHEIVVSPSSEIGSVGVYQTHRDMSGAAEQAGIKFTLISAGAHKTDGNPYEPLSSDALADAQQAVDDYYAMFVQDVAQGRHDGVGDPEIDQQAVADGTIFGGGRTFTAKRAVKAGLADRVATLPETISRLSSGRAKIRRYAAESDIEPVRADGPSSAESAEAAEVSPEDRQRLLNVLPHLVGANAA